MNNIKNLDLSKIKDVIIKVTPYIVAGVGLLSSWAATENNKKHIENLVKEEIKKHY